MLESSLANWDGSKTPVNSTPPGSAQKNPNSSTSKDTVSAAIPSHLETSAGGKDANLGLGYRAEGHRTSGGGGADAEREQAPRHPDSSRRASWDDSKTLENSTPPGAAHKSNPSIDNSALSVSIPPHLGASSSLNVASSGLIYRVDGHRNPGGGRVDEERDQAPRSTDDSMHALLAPVATSSLAAPKSSLDPRPPLHFGPPREILTAPLTSSRSAPSVLGSVLARPPSSIAVSAPDLSGIMTAPSTSTSGSIFGQPGGAHLDPNASTTAFGFGFGFGTPGPALRVPSVSQLAVSIPAPDPIPVLSSGPSSATSKRPPAPAFSISTLNGAGPKRSPYSGTPSPLASALARTSSATSPLQQSLSPLSRPGSGGWWLAAPRENAAGMTIEPRQTSEARHTSSWSHSLSLARTQGEPSKGMEKEKEKDKELVTYTSRAKKQSTGNAHGSNESINEKDPSLPPDDARLLFTPSPSPVRELFSPPPHQDAVRPVRRPPPPGVGVARRIVRDNRSGQTQTARPQKRKREVMQYVAIPRASYPFKRPRTEERGYGGRARARSEHSPRERSESVYSARTSGYDYDEGEDGRSRPKKRVRGEVHMSLGDALNAAWTQNEASGAIAVGGKRKDPESYTDAHKHRAGTVEVVVAPRKRPKVARREDSEEKKKAKPRTTGDHGQSEKRIRKAPRRPDDDVTLAPAPVPARSLGWCEESGDTTRLRFDVLVEEVDRMAYEALLHSGVPGVHEPWAQVPLSVGARSCPVPPCPVWPIIPAADADGDVSAGGSILWNGQGEDGRRRVRDANTASGSKPRDEEPRGRSKQKKILPPPQTRLSPAQHRKEPLAPPEPQISQVEQPLRRLDLSKPIPKVKPKPRALAISPKSHGSMPSKPELSPLLSPSPFAPHLSAASPPPPPKLPLASPRAPASLHPIDSHTEPAVEEDAPMILSAKARGKQKAPSEHAERTPSPIAADTWPLQSVSRGRRSTSRGRRSTSRRTSASRVHNGAAVHSSADSMNMSLFLNEFDTSPTRIPTASLKTSPDGFPYDSTIPPLHPYNPSSVHHLPFAHSSERQLSPPPFEPFIDHQPYGDGTIDPSLLGGGTMEPDVQNSYDDPEMEDYYGQDEEDARMRSSSPSAASSSSPVAPVAPVAPSAPAPTRRVSQRGHVQRYVPSDMLPTDLFDSDDDFAGSSPSIRHPRSPPLKPKPAAKPKRTAKGRALKDSKPKVNNAGETKRPPLASRRS
ncbi:hypothetical protein C8R47DRAFT_565967 [Mycena vitilis]|nr:hypothetical protein C8R47DRAFT_565967 [Mycena vitilis]